MVGSRWLWAVVASLPLSAAAAGAADEPDWVQPMRTVHAAFKGRPGTIAHFGDSITDTLAYWTPLLYKRANMSKEMTAAWQTVKAYQRPECWRQWKGPKYGNQGRMTIRWAHRNIEGWLKVLNPEVALIMFGTNDLHSVPLAEHTAALRAVIRKCLDNGTVVILSTIPPRHRFVEKAADFAAAQHALAREMKVPLIDFHAEILKRRPDDWDGALDAFKAYSGYDVPTLLARDGVHPSHPKKYRSDYSAEALRCCGFSLRNALSLMAYADVIDRVLPTAGAGAGYGGERGAASPRQAWFPKVPPLPEPTGQVIRVSTADELRRATEQVKAGGTILVDDGRYRFNRWIDIGTDGVALRGASGDPARVVIDGGGIGEMIRFTACSDVTVADLSITNIKWNGFKINSETGVQRLTIRNCIIHNVWQRGVKGVKVPKVNREALRPTGCRVQYCLFYNDHPKRYADDEADTAKNFKGNYIGGIDVMYAKGWVISDNVFVGIRGRTGEARGAVFLWHETEDCTVERNVIIDCDSGICLGNSHKPADVRFHAARCVVRNNFVTRAHENGILADYTRDCRILNNTVHDPAGRLGRLIRLVHANDGLLVANNLLSGPKVRIETKSAIKLKNNVAGRDLAAHFTDAARGNLHLKTAPPGVTGRGLPLPDVKDDIDGNPRPTEPDIGADEFTASSKRTSQSPRPASVGVRPRPGAAVDNESQ